MDCHLRKATHLDLPTILEFIVDDEFAQQTDSLSSEFFDRYQKAFDDIIKSKYFDYYVFEHDASVIGSFQWMELPTLGFKGETRVQIETIRIKRSLRGQGFGTKMMQEAIKLARDKGATCMQLTSGKRREGAHNLYTRLGMEATHEGFKLRWSLA